MSNSGYYFGVSCRMVDISAKISGGATARECWEEAYRAIQHRLPEWRSVSSEFVQYDPDEDDGWSLDEALCYLLLSRVSHADFEHKQAALTALAEVVVNAPGCLCKGLQAVFDRDTPNTSLLTILSLLLNAEQPPFPCSLQIVDRLKALQKCELVGLRVVAERLLSRVPE
jgi:hypothetical protein